MIVEPTTLVCVGLADGHGLFLSKGGGAIEGVLVENLMIFLCTFIALCAICNDVNLQDNDMWHDIEYQAMTWLFSI